MKKFLSVTLSLLLAASMPLSALAETYDLTQGSITVEAKADGNQYVSQTGGVQQEQQTTETVIHQTDSNTTSTTNTITIQAEKNQTAQVTISDVNINARSEGKAAISTGGDGSVTIELDGDNTAKGGDYHAGVEKNNGGSLTIGDADKDGKLTAEGGKYGAGIGGGKNGSGEDITISGGEVNASGGAYGAGIGGGYYENGSDITITGGEVMATGGEYGAGIGGGDHGNGSDISITGSKVNATGGRRGAGIGGGNYRIGKDITISGGEVNASGGVTGAGIGGGCYGAGTNITVSGDAKLKVQGGVEDKHYGAGAGIGTGGKYGNHGGPNGAEVEPDICALKPDGKIEYYAPGTPMSGAPTKTVTNSTGDHVWDGGRVTKPATCTEKGVRTYTCTGSSHTKTEDIPALNHSFAGQAYVSDNNATCEQDGTKTAKCVRYGQGGCTATDTVTDVGSKLGHDYEAKDYVSNGDATCEQDGTKTAKCVRYGQGGCSATDTVTDVGSKLGHDFKDYVSDGNATCEQDGTKTAKCVRYGQGGCTATDTVTDTGSKLGHDFTDYVFNNDASYTEDGTETAHCNHAGCNKTHTRRAEETRWPLFQVTDERGWHVPYTESRNGNVLTITVNQNTATLSGTIAGLLVLKTSGITTIVFKTTEAESTFHIADLLPGTSYNLAHKDTEVTFNLDGNDIANLLK